MLLRVELPINDVPLTGVRYAVPLVFHTSCGLASLIHHATQAALKRADRILFCRHAYMNENHVHSPLRWERNASSVSQAHTTARNAALRLSDSCCHARDSVYSYLPKRKYLLFCQYARKDQAWIRRLRLRRPKEWRLPYRYSVANGKCSSYGTL